MDLYNYPTPVNISIDNIAYDANNNNVDAVVNLDFVDYAQPGNISLTLWVIEDSIDPVNQSNYYSGDASHPYGNLPSPITAVNANDYQHRHTTKKIETDTWGDAIGNTNPLPGDTYQAIFNNISLDGIDEGQAYLVATIGYNNVDYTKRLILNSAEEHIEGMVSTVNNQVLNHKINIFPNPMKQIGFIEFTVERDDIIDITIYNILGKNVMSKKAKRYVTGNHAVAINSLDFSSGTYFVEVKTTNGISKQKFTIIH